MRREGAQKFQRTQEARAARFIADVRELEQRDRKLSPPRHLLRLGVGERFDQFEPAAQRTNGFVDAAGGEQDLARPLQIEGEHAPMLDAGGCGCGGRLQDRDGVAIGGERVVDAGGARVRLCDAMVARGDIERSAGLLQWHRVGLRGMGGEALAERSNRLIPALEPVQQKSNLIAGDRKLAAAHEVA